MFLGRILEWITDDIKDELLDFQIKIGVFLIDMQDRRAAKMVNIFIEIQKINWYNEKAKKRSSLRDYKKGLIPNGSCNYYRDV